MPPRPPFPGRSSDRRSPREAALIAEVLNALSSELRASQAPEGSDDDTARSHLASSDEVQELIAAAVSEINRVAPTGITKGGIAPVLGNGVLQSLIRQQHEGLAIPAAPPGDSIDERR